MTWEPTQLRPKTRRRGQRLRSVCTALVLVGLMLPVATAAVDLAPHAVEATEVDGPYNGSTAPVADNEPQQAGLIIVVAPNGGEKWPAGSTQTIRWRYIDPRCDGIRIQIYRGPVGDKDNSSLYAEYVIPPPRRCPPPVTPLFNWYIDPDKFLIGTDYWVNISWLGGPPEDHSDGHFAITPGAGGPPAAPTNLTATAVSSSQIDLVWQDNAINEDGFRIERSVGALWTEIATVGENASRYSDSGLLPSVTYRYRVKAYNTAGDSDPSNEASAKTLPGTPPAAPSNLTATAVSPTRIDLAWQDNAGDELGFRIQRKTGDTGSWGEIVQLGADATSYQDTACAPGMTYHYRVFAFNHSGSSAYSNEASATTPNPIPAAPSNLAAVGLTPTRVQVWWQDNSINEDRFKIERVTTPTGTWAEIATVESNVASYLDAGVTPDTTYVYRVRAHNVMGDSAYSNEAPAATPPPPALRLDNRISRFAHAASVEAVCADGASATTLWIDVAPWLRPGDFAVTIVESGAPGEDGVLTAAAKWSGQLRFQYTAPATFCRSQHPEDANAPSRPITLQIKSAGRNYGSVQFDLYRAPVVLLHGLWSDAGHWRTLKQHLTADAGIYPDAILTAYDYRETCAGRFATNKDVCYLAIHQCLAKARRGGYSAERVDVIAHGLGGVLARVYLGDRGSIRYWGDVRRLITIGTPHAGSQMADYVAGAPALGAVLTALGLPAGEGALHDLRVDSEAVDSWLNGSAYEYRVPSHAIAGTAGLSDGTTAEQTIHELVALSQYGPDEWASRLASVPRRLLGEDNDLVVARSSQIGGLGRSSAFEPASHANQAQSAAIHQRLVELVNTPPSDPLFDTQGFAPPDLHYAPLFSPPPPGGPQRAAVETVEIVSPTSGSTATAGTTITVAVNVLGPAEAVFVAGAGGSDNRTTEPFEFDVGIPASVVGLSTIVVVGFGPTGITSSDAVALQVATTATVTGLETFPSGVFTVLAGREASLAVRGRFSDGLVRDVTDGSAGTTYAIDDPAIAEIAGDGVVRGLAPGETMLRISNRGVHLDLPVVVMEAKYFPSAARRAWTQYR